MICFLNGRFLPIHEAAISPMDRGFLFGDAVYEVIRYFDGWAVGLEAHRARMQRGLEAMDFPPGEAKELSRQFAETGDLLMERNGHRDGAVYWQVSRGACDQRIHLPEREVRPTVFGFAEAHPPLEACRSVKSIEAILAEDLRWRRCDIKSTNLLGNILSKIEARERGADDAILHRDGAITEAANANVFCVRDGRILTPGSSDDRGRLLPGVTRILLNEAGIEYDETTISLDDLRSSDEIILTSSRALLTSVVRLDGRSVGDGCAGPVAAAMNGRLIAWIADQISRSARNAG